jgi:serine/threonine protein kinase
VPISPGTKLGQYEVQDFIGQGAMGRVYRAYHVQLERTGAVKVMQAIAPDPDTTARFRHEAQAIAQMRHPNILNVYDFGEVDGTPYMIVEYDPGGSLATRLAAGLLDPATALRYLRGIASGLDYAHAHGVVHRDVKPANVLLEPDDTPVLADFGLAKLMEGSSLKSITGVTTGTPAYMAPEQVTGSKVGPPADRYSLASIAYEMLTGVIPFDGLGLMELLYAQVHREPPPPSARNSSLGPRVDAVIMRGLSKDAGARWESCIAMVDALAAAMVQPPVPVMRTVVMTPASTLPLATPAAAPVFAEPEARDDGLSIAYPSPPPTTVKKPSRRGLFALLAVLVIFLLLLLSAGVYLAANQRPTLDLSPSTVVAGGTLMVTGRHLPANQQGEIQVHSPVRIFPFRANANGLVNAEISVPADAGIGDHLVKLCWNGACRIEASLHVLASGVAQTSPPRSASASPSPSATPGARPAPSPSPSPSPAHSPTPSPQAYITISSISKLKGFTVTFHNFRAGGWTVAVVQYGTGRPAGSVSLPSSATYSKAFATPTLVVSLANAYVLVCTSAGGSCVSSATVLVRL